MNTPANPNHGDDSIKDFELHAYVDGELSPTEVRDLERRLAADEDARALVADLTAQRDALQSKFTLPIDCPVTHRMADEVRATARARRRGNILRLAAMSAALILTTALGYFARDIIDRHAPSAIATEPAFVKAAMGAHSVYTPEVRHPVEVVAAEEQHLLLWLSKRLGKAVRAPRLVDHGFNLVGGRLLADGDRPAAQLMYEDGKGRRVTLFVRAGTGLDDAAFQVAVDGKISTFYWIDSDVGYALSGVLERAELVTLARAVHSELATPATPANAAPSSK